MHHNFHIGIDLDNTILAYLPLFHRLGREKGWLDDSSFPDKASLKQGLVRGTRGDRDAGEQRWQQLQAWVYGPYIGQAEEFPGFRNWVFQQRKAGYQLSIVSHKSERSHFDPEVPIREHARRSLRERGFFLPLNQGGLGFEEREVFFEDHREAKIHRIHSLGITHFIDDLPAVLSHPEFPTGVQPLLFGESSHKGIPGFASWAELQSFTQLLPYLQQTLLTLWEPIEGGGNNRLFRLHLENRSPLVLKTYWQDPEQQRNRKEAEWSYLSFLAQHLPDQAPEPIANISDGILMTELPGLSPKDRHEPVARAMSTFLGTLANLDQLNPSNLRPAAHARFRLRGFVEDLNQRFESLVEASQNLPEVADLIREKIDPLKTKAEHHFHQRCLQFGLDPDKELPAALHFPSPSDFGPHNAVEDEEGKIRFIDFEYAGWDDPAKLMADMFHHVGHHMPAKTRCRLIEAFFSANTKDPELRHRFIAVADLVGVEWILIVLNVLTRAEAQRKTFAGAGKKLIPARIQRAKALCDEFRWIDNHFPH